MKVPKRKTRWKKSNGSKLRQQHKMQAIKNKYGPAGKPAPVTVKKLDGETGEWIVDRVVDQSKIRRR